MLEKLLAAIKKFSIKRFLLSNYILLTALVCEVIALLMDKGVISGDERTVSGLTVAGVIIMFIQLVRDGLRKKYRYYSKKWGMGPYAENGDASQNAEDEK